MCYCSLCTNLAIDMVYKQCDQNWRNFATWATFYKSLSNGWGFIQCLAIFWTYFGKIVIFGAAFQSCTWPNIEKEYSHLVTLYTNSQPDLHLFYHSWLKSNARPRKQSFSCQKIVSEGTSEWGKFTKRNWSHNEPFIHSLFLDIWWKLTSD